MRWAEWKCLNIFTYFEEGLAAIMLPAIVILICFNIFIRYFTGVSFAWIYEVSALLLIWITFLGASIRLRQRRCQEI